MPTRYPLQAALALREAELDAAKHALASHERGLDRADEHVIRAKGALERHLRATEAHRTRDREWDPSGRSASELLRVQAYSERLATEAQAHRDAVQDARNQQKRATDAVNAARDALAAARAELEAVQRHHERWLEQQKKLADAREEAEVDDLVADRHGRDAG